MTQPPAATDALRAADAGKTNAAKDQASQLAGSAADKAGDVANTARDQASRVVGTAMDQAQQLMGLARQQLDEQAGTQARQLSASLKSASKNFTDMATSGSASSPAQSLVNDLGEHSGRLGDYLERTPPREMVNDLQDFGRRRPAAFLVGAAVAGLVVGRLGKSVKDAPKISSTASAEPASPAVPNLGGQSWAARTAPGLDSTSPGAATIYPANASTR